MHLLRARWKARGNGILDGMLSEGVGIGFGEVCKDTCGVGASIRL